MMSLKPSMAELLISCDEKGVEARTPALDVTANMSQKKCNKQHKKIWFFGHFGSSNFGNEITFQTALYHLQSRLPEARFACICTDPKILAATRKIASVPISRDFGGPWKRRTRLAGFLRKIFIGVPRELFRWFEGFRILKGADMFIVPGTGLLTDAYGLQQWGPYSLFKWSLIAKLRGSNILFLSVGVGPFYTALGKFFVKSALSMANFRSYRDEASMNWLKAIGFRTNHDQVYPDLAFSVPETMLLHEPDKKSSRTVVGIGLMGYAGKYSVANPRDEIYTSYLECLAAFVKWLVGREFDVRLLLSEAADTACLSDFKFLLKTVLSANEMERIIDQPPNSVEEFLPQLAATDFVVATRFHNVLLSLLLNKPVIAISFHHKCSSLMSEMGLSEYCHDINRMSVATLIEQFLALEKKRGHVKSLIREKVEQSRRILDAQYDLVIEGK